MIRLPVYPDARVRQALPLLTDDFAALWQAVAQLAARADAHETTPFAVLPHDATAYRCIGAGNSWIPAGTPAYGVVRQGENLATVWIVTSGDALTVATGSNDLRVRLPNGIVPAAAVRGTGSLVIGGAREPASITTIAEDPDLYISRDGAALATDAAFAVAFVLPFPLRLR